MRVKSDRPARNGGWLHAIAGAPPPSLPREYVPRPPRRPPPDWPALLRRFGRDTAAAEVERLAAVLGVSPGSLSCLGIVWYSPRHAWGFPMRDAAQQVVGIRLRTKSGFKFAVNGSRNGIFWPEELSGAGPLLICEGPTDTAALLDLGYDAIGRPSCASAVEMVIAVVEHLRRRDVVIVADTDGPGINGADRLAQALTEAGHRPKVIQPTQGKDARAWVQAGTTRAVVDAVIASALYWRP
jgi:5S rRNA maturation endonuclease (ribonuclease M5)